MSAASRRWSPALAAPRSRPRGARASPPSATGVGGVGLTQVGAASTSPIYVDRTRPAGRPSSSSSSSRAARSASSTTATRWRSRSSTSRTGSRRAASRGCSRSPSIPTTRATGRFYVYYTTATATSRSTSSARPRTPGRARSSRRSGRDRRSRTRSCRTTTAASCSSGPTATSTLGTGDGGCGGDPLENAQNTDSLLGKLLRIDPAGTERRLHGSAPTTRSSAGRAGRDLRLRPAQSVPLLVRLATGTSRSATSARSAWEEIDYVTPPRAQRRNFGWDAYEGYEPLSTTARRPGSPRQGTTFPIHVYPRATAAQHGCAIIGGLVVRDPEPERVSTAATSTATLQRRHPQPRADSRGPSRRHHRASVVARPSSITPGRGTALRDLALGTGPSIRRCSRRPDGRRR